MKLKTIFSLTISAAFLAISSTVAFANQGNSNKKETPVHYICPNNNSLSRPYGILFVTKLVEKLQEENVFDENVFKCFCMPYITGLTQLVNFSNVFITQNKQEVDKIFTSVKTASSKAKKEIDELDENKFKELKEMAESLFGTDKGSDKLKINKDEIEKVSLNSFKEAIKASKDINIDFKFMPVKK